MNFEKLQQQAKESWNKWENDPLPKIMVGDATCGNAAGAQEVIETLNQELKKRNVKADIMHVGCIGLCYVEPIVDIIKPGMPRISYGEVTPKKMVELIDSYWRVVEFPDPSFRPEREAATA